MMTVLSLALLGSRPPPPGCYLRVIPDYSFGVIYRPVLKPSPDCGADVSLRVRKTSTLNRRKNGAPYQPIIPDGSAKYGGVYSWTLGKFGGTIPAGELWTLYSWRWQWLDGKVWRDGVLP